MRPSVTEVGGFFRLPEVGQRTDALPSLVMQWPWMLPFRGTATEVILRCRPVLDYPAMEVLPPLERPAFGKLVEVALRVETPNALSALTQALPSTE